MRYVKDYKLPLTFKNEKFYKCMPYANTHSNMGNKVQNDQKGTSHRSPQSYVIQLQYISFTELCE